MIICRFLSGSSSEVGTMLLRGAGKSGRNCTHDLSHENPISGAIVTCEWNRNFSGSFKGMKDGEKY